MIVTLNVKLGTLWNADIEILDLSTLDEVHEAIQQAVDFDNDHLYAFYVARSAESRDRILYDDENGQAFKLRIGDLFPLPPKKTLFYLFDWGDSWIFKVSQSRKVPHEPADGVEYPRVVKESGERPIQYDFDEED